MMKKLILGGLVAALLALKFARDHWEYTPELEDQRLARGQ